MYNTFENPISANAMNNPENIRFYSAALHMIYSYVCIQQSTLKFSLVKRITQLKISIQ